MNKNYLAWLCFLSVTTIHADSWWQSIKTNVTNLFSSSVQEITQKELQNAKKIVLTSPAGNIKITSWQQNHITLETIKNGASDDKVHATTVVENQVATISSKGQDRVDYNLLVPEHTKLDITTQEGSISIEGMAAPITAQTTHGSITLTNCAHTTQCTTTHGDITIHLSELNQAVACDASSQKGKITLYTNNHINAQLKAHAPQGKVHSTIPVTLTSWTTTLDSKSWKEFKQKVDGTIGIPSDRQIILYSNHGSIFIINEEE